MEKTKVLFVCIHNSARSQMAEAFLNDLGGCRFEAESAGMEPGTLNTLVIAVMKEAGLDISNNKTKSVFDFFKQGKKYHYVITVCDEAAGQACPIFPGLIAKTIHWSFEDPSSFNGTYEEKLEKTRIVRNKIKTTVEQFIKAI
ncbi:MAG: arsenate reductase [Elusimicrobia bacterium RIFOXYB2_FULL_48_7]|nr:MAG: arsenate reductase [Elusimicrobia bacterium RIFOXYB2_FULL_48_7]